MQGVNEQIATAESSSMNKCAHCNLNGQITIKSPKHQVFVWGGGGEAKKKKKFNSQQELKEEWPRNVIQGKGQAAPTILLN